MGLGLNLSVGSFGVGYLLVLTEEQESHFGEATDFFSQRTIEVDSAWLPSLSKYNRTNPLSAFIPQSGATKLVVNQIIR